MDDLPKITEMARRYLAANPLATDWSLLPPGLHLTASPVITDINAVVYEPMLCVILEGEKRTTLGAESFSYGAGQYLVVSADLPVSGCVVAAPYMAIGIPLDAAMIAEMLVETGRGGETTAPGRGLVVSDLDGPLADAVRRLVELLDRPADAPVLGPMIRREIVWRLLQGEHGAMVRDIGTAGGRLTQINRAIRWLRAHYAEPMRIEILAAVGGMSVTSFHRHFKAVTAMSPLQYQKRLRLQEARNRLLGQSGDVAGVGYAVGYESPSQFSREYSRLFGLPPGRDVERLKASMRLALAA